MLFGYHPCTEQEPFPHNHAVTWETFQAESHRVQHFMNQVCYQQNTSYDMHLARVTKYRVLPKFQRRQLDAEIQPNCQMNAPKERFNNLNHILRCNNTGKISHKDGKIVFI